LSLKNLVGFTYCGDNCNDKPSASDVRPKQDIKKCPFSWEIPKAIPRWKFQNCEN